MNKICTNCEAEKNLNEFVKDKRKKLGVGGRCLACERLRGKNKYEKDRVRHLVRGKKWRESNKDRMAELQKRWKEENLDHYQHYCSQYRKENRDAINKRVSEWKKNNKSKIRAQNRRRRDGSQQDTFTENDERLIINAFDSKCFCCGTGENLQVDHHRPLSKGNALTIKNAVLLCGECNRKKFTKDPEEFYTPAQLKELDLIFRLLPVTSDS